MGRTDLARLLSCCGPDPVAPTCDYERGTAVLHGKTFHLAHRIRLDVAPPALGWRVGMAVDDCEARRLATDELISVNHDLASGELRALARHLPSVVLQRDVLDDPIATTASGLPERRHHEQRLAQ